LNKQTSNIHNNCQPVVKWFCLHKTRGVVWYIQMHIVKSLRLLVITFVYFLKYFGNFHVFCASRTIWPLVDSYCEYLRLSNYHSQLVSHFLNSFMSHVYEGWRRLIYLFILLILLRINVCSWTATTRKDSPEGWSRPLFIDADI
jgi:small-conductance mechanosensitive channel